MTATKQTELLPCPFCGGDAEFIECSDASHYVMCSSGSVAAKLHTARQKRRLPDCGTAAANPPPKPVQGEVVRVVGVRISAVGFGSYIADSAMGIGAAQPGEVREPLMTVAQHNRIMAAAKPDADHFRDPAQMVDAELVELLVEAEPLLDLLRSEKTIRGDGNPPGLTISKCESLLDRIEAKLAELRKVIP